MKSNWVTLDKISGTEGVETVNISAMGNMGEERKSQMVVKTANGAEATLNLAQAGVPIVGAVRIYQDIYPTIISIVFEQNYGISYPRIKYMAVGTRTTQFSAVFNIDAKYIHDVVNYLADTYPDDEWDKSEPYLVIRWTTPEGQDIVAYVSTIPETGRIALTSNNPIVGDLYIGNGSEITVSVANVGESIYVDLYKIHFTS